LEKRTLLGKYSVAIGSNFEGARLSGIRVNGTRVLFFVLSSASCAGAGILYASQLSSGQPSVGTGFEFSIIVAAVLGGVSLAGGRGTVLGTVAGAGIIGVIHVALNQNFVNPFWQQIIEGVLLVGVVALDSLLNRGFRRPTWLGIPRKPNQPANVAS
jgi:ribose/xylose/arabinose/galactoside ABC-type transport system permease subunit